MNSPSRPDPLRLTEVEPDPLRAEAASLSLRLVAASEAPWPRPGMPAGDNATQPYRPVLRPPTPLLHVLDDHQQSAEVVRVRTDVFEIGRTQGDLRLPHDRLLSSRHARISRHQAEGQYTWTLEDLNSSNGTFVRVWRARLEAGSIFLIGRTRLRFELSAGVRGSPATAPRHEQAGVAQHGLQPSLVELVPLGEGRRLALSGTRQRLGRDPEQATIVLDDVAVNPCHAVLAMHEAEKWSLEDLDSRNGLWIRVNRVKLVHGASFLLGEQVFVFTLP
ncbi:MAG: FHA domain-containing protein [Pirellulales bacterium]|nr:FHA domain-containing protein [Pirellulales bacterium]